MNIRQFIYKYLWWTYRPIKNYIIDLKYNIKMKRESKRLDSLEPVDKRVFYLGITAHSNLGDMGQHYCIRNWISENLADYKLEMFEAEPVVCRKYNFLEKLKEIYRPQDIIIFQSGYTTQDLGGIHNLMHEMVVQMIPDANILMMPQTVYFMHEENKRRTGQILNTAKNMLFLARDRVSYETAKQMMPNVRIEAFPDIVTTLIGTLQFDNKRDGVCICTRNDGEKLYTYAEIDRLEKTLNDDGINVVQKDTQAKRNFKEIRSNLQRFIEEEIASYSHFKVTITDRYHGTIFSLCAGTPVIILRTTDHKVITGADWFKGIYDDSVFVAKDLDEALSLAKMILKEERLYKLSPHFKDEYYSKLKDLFFNVLM